MEKLFRKINQVSRKIAVLFVLIMVVSANLWGDTRTKNNPAAGTYDLSVDFFGSDSPLSNGDDLLINSNDTDGVIIILPENIILGTLRIYGKGTCEIKVRGSARVSQFILGDQSLGGNANVIISNADGYSSSVLNAASFDTTTYNGLFEDYEKHLDITAGSTMNITDTWEVNSASNSSDVVINNNGSINVTGDVNVQNSSPTTTITGTGSTIITGNIYDSGADSFREDVESSPTVILTAPGTFIWQGGDTTNPTDCSTAANWIGGVVPSNDGSADIIIPGTAASFPVITTVDTVNVKSVQLGENATLTVNGSLTCPSIELSANSSIIYASDVTISNASQFTGAGTVKTSGKLSISTDLTGDDNKSLSYECGTLNLANSLVCSKILVNDETYFNTSGNMYYLVAESSDGITFGNTVTVNANGNQALIAGNVYSKNNANVNIEVNSGTLNHTEETANHNYAWGENLTVKLTGSGTTLSMGEYEAIEYNVVVTASSGDVYFAGTGTFASLDDSSCNCNIHFGNGDDAYSNAFTFKENLTINKNVFIDKSCAGLKSSGTDNVTLTLKGNLTNLSNKLTSKLGVNFVFDNDATVSTNSGAGSSIPFADVTFKKSATIQGSHSFDNLKVEVVESGKQVSLSGTQTISENLILKGASDLNLLQISGTTGSSFAITRNQLNGQYLSIDYNGPTVTGGNYYTYDSCVDPGTSPAPSGWFLIAQGTYIWQGGATGHEDDWTFAENWIPQQNPIESTNPANIILPAGRSYYPQINEDVMTAAGTSPYSLQSLKLESGVYFVLPEAGSIQVDSLIMEGTSEFQVDGSLTLNGDFTNSRYIYGNGKLIIPSGKTLTVPTGSDDSIVKLKLENSGTVECAGSATFRYNIINDGIFNCGTSGLSIFEGEYSGEGEFKANEETTVFKKDTDFSNATSFDATENGEFIIYNTVSSESISLKTKNGMTFNKIYFWGNTDIIVNGSVSAYQVGTYKGSAPAMWNASSDFTSKITGTGTLTVGAGGIYVDRCSATNGVIGTFEIDTTVNCSSKLQTYAGTKLVINETLSVNNFGHNDTSTSPKTQFDINGNLVVTNTIDLAETTGATQLNISSTGKLKAKEIKWSNTASYSNGSDTSPFNNNGEVEISDSITLPNFSNCVPYSGDGKIILNGDTTATIQNNYKGVAGVLIETIDSSNDTIINNTTNGLLKIKNFTTTDTTNTNKITFGESGNTQIQNLVTNCVVENNSNLYLKNTDLVSDFTNTNNGTLSFETLDLDAANLINNGTLKVLTTGSSITAGTLFTNNASGRIISETAGTRAVLSLGINFIDNGNNSGASSISNDVKIVFNGTADQSFTPNTTNNICYTNPFEVNKTAGDFTFTDDFEGSNLSLTDGKVIFNGNITLTSGGTNYTDANFETEDDIIISGGTSASPKTLTAKSITTAGSILPTDNRNSYLKLVATNGNINIGTSSNPKDIGASTNYYNKVVLDAGNKDITVTGNIYTSNIDVTCKSVYFEHLIYVGGVSINASDTVSINGLKSETLNINSSARNIKMGSLIELTGSDDLIIDYPLQIIDGSEDVFDAVFNVAGNIIVRNNSIRNTIGSINSDGDTPRSIKLKAGTGKSIQIENGNSTNAGFGNINPLDSVQFQSDLILSEKTTITATTVSFVENGISTTIDSGATNVELIINGNFENSKTVTLSPPVNITGNLLNSGTLNIESDITLSGNFEDSGTWNQDALKSIILNGTDAHAKQTFAAKDDSVDYSIVVNKSGTNGVLEFTNPITLTNLDCSTNSYKGKLLFKGIGNQSLSTENFVYESIEINKVDESGNPVSIFTFDGDLSVKNLSILDGSVQFIGDITLTSGGTNYTDANFATTDDIIISDGTDASAPRTLTAKSITTAGSILPTDGSSETNRNSFLKLVAANGNINIGTSLNPKDIGASSNYYNTVILDAGTAYDVVVSGEIYTSNIDVKCRNVEFNDLYCLEKVLIHAFGNVHLYGLKSEFLQIDSTASSVKMGGRIELTGTNDFIIDFPLQILEGNIPTDPDFDALFDVAANIIICDNSIRNTVGSINSDGGTPRAIKLKTGTNKSIQISNGQSSNSGFGNIKKLDTVQFLSDFVLSETTRITSTNVNFAAESSVETTSTQNVILKIHGDDNIVTGGIETKHGFINSGIVEYGVDLEIETGSFNDTGTYTNQNNKLIFSAANEQLLCGKNATYKNVLVNQNLSTGKLVVQSQNASDVITFENFEIDNSNCVTFNSNTNFNQFTDSTKQIEIIFNCDTNFIKYAADDVECIFNTTGKISLLNNKTFNFGSSSGYKNFVHINGETEIEATVNANNIKLGKTICKNHFICNAQQLYFIDEVQSFDENSYITANTSIKTSKHINPVVVLNGSLLNDETDLVNEYALFDKDLIVTGNSSSVNDIEKIKVTNDLVFVSDGTVNLQKAETKNAVLYSGKIVLDSKAASGSGIEQFICLDAQNVILLGSSYSIKDNETGFENEYAYNQIRLSNSSVASDDYQFGKSYETYGILAQRTSDKNYYDGEISVTSDNRIKVQKRFYANGLSCFIEGTASADNKWYIQIPDVSDAQNGFAEFYNCDIKNCVVQNLSGVVDADNCRIPAENCVDSGNNTNIEFDDFVIINAYTVRDNAIRIEFNAPLRNLHGEINGRAAVGKTSVSNPVINQIKYSAGMESGVLPLNVSYSELYSSPDCTDDTRIRGNVNLFDPAADGGRGAYYCYIKAGTKNSELIDWNTDATGKSNGATDAKSTNHKGEHKTTVPFIDMPRALTASEAQNSDDLNYVITDVWGKRIKNYSSRTNNGKSYGGPSDSVHEVSDKTGPVLYSVRTGQETHSLTEATTQKPYDSHNFIEFRYSEKVDFYKDSGEIISELSSANVDNIPVTDDLGALKNDVSLEDNLELAGLAKIQKGKIHTGKQGVDDKYVNAFYKADEYSIKISVAGLTSGTVTDSDGYLYHNWVGYIEDAVLPQGSVWLLVDENNINKNVKDRAVSKNPQEYYSTDFVLNVNNAEDGVYGKWDVSKPVFAAVRQNNDKPWNGDLFLGVYETEAIGNNSGVGSTLDRIEFHLLDNTPDYSSGNAEWFTEVGWCRSGSSGTKNDLVINNYSYAADIFGGARPFDSDETRRTSGGIRYCSIKDSAIAFTYDKDSSSNPGQAFSTTKTPYVGASSLIFTGTSTPQRSSRNKEGLYFAMPLDDLSLDVATTFTVKYDDSKAYVTDLAGNRLKTTTIKTLDRVPPSFYLTVSPVTQNQIEVVFVKKLANSSKINFIPNGQSNRIDITEDFTNLITECFDLITINSSGQAQVASDISIDTSVPAVIDYKDNENGSTFTLVKLTLTRNITLEDIKSLYLRIKNPDSFGEYSIDLYTKKENSRVTLIQDDNHNYVQMYTAHALSDFAVGVVEPLYAYDSSMVDSEGNIISESVWNNSQNNGSWSVHDWNRNQQTYGSLPEKRELAVVADVKDGTADNLNPPVNLKMFLSNRPDERSVSTQINFDLNPNPEWRIWLPNLTTPVFSTIAEANNTNTSQVEAQMLNAESTDKVIFELDESIVNLWSDGNQVSFLFALMDSGGNPVSIMHAPQLDMDHDKQYLTTTQKYPLYALRQTNQGDILSLDLWSFRIKSLAQQRSGVTILNNVIDLNNDEKTVIKVDVAQKGRVNIFIMTIDGNIVDYLERGELDIGEHFYTWDGSNRNGKKIARGMYFVRIVGDGFDETRKIMVVK